MRQAVITGLTCCAMASAAMAEPLQLTPAEVDQITAGGLSLTLVIDQDEIEGAIQVLPDGGLRVDQKLIDAADLASDGALEQAAASLERPLARLNDRLGSQLSDAHAKPAEPSFIDVATAVEVVHQAVSSDASLDIPQAVESSHSVAERTVEFSQPVVVPVDVDTATAAVNSPPPQAVSSIDVGSLIETALGQAGTVQSSHQTSHISNASGGIQSTDAIAHATAGASAIATATNFSGSR